jgi:hypothetical protein
VDRSLARRRRNGSVIGKRPHGVGGVRQWFHDVASRRTTGSDGWTFYSGDRSPGPEENAPGEGH